MLTYRLLYALSCLFLSCPLFSQTTIQWDQRFGGDQFEELTKIQNTSDGGFILGGSSNSAISGDVSEANMGQSDFWMVKTDSLGNKLWDKRFGGSGTENLQYIEQTTDGGYILGGWSFSDMGGDKSENNRGFPWTSDYWIVKTDALGNKVWDRTFGGSENEQLWHVEQTTDGGYIMGGWSISGISGDKTEANKNSSGFSFDYWVVKTDHMGIKQWDR
ncbi:MAG: T9SS C-terminal target domain-containing protein, partial [Bacteroidota bacterium]